MTKDTLIRKLNDRSARIGVIGLGYVGLPLILRFSDVGYKVTGFDIDESKVSRLNSGQSYIERIKPQVIVTFSPDGGYGHPDHIAIGQFTLAAIL